MLHRERTGESYDDPEVEAIVNEHCIAVKVDRRERRDDECPDLDRRYQIAVSLKRYPDTTASFFSSGFEWMARISIAALQFPAKPL